MQEPIETIIIKAQQNFDIDGGLNPIEIEIKYSRITNLLKKYKNVIYKITPLGILFPASITKDTNQIFILGKNFSGVKKSILNKKNIWYFSNSGFKKINNWNDIKGQSVWTNAAFKDHKEISDSSHLCFPFITKSFSDLCSFSIFLQDDSDKKIEFKPDEKKKSIFNFQIDIYLIWVKDL